MTTLDQDLHNFHPGRQRLLITTAVLLSVPGIATQLFDIPMPAPIAAALFGAAIVGAAFLLSWAAEVAQLDISAGLALAVLALIAVLPEYAVDFVFTWAGGQAYEQYGTACMPPGYEGESPCSLALANMTGANRLLIGIGWSMVVFIAWWRYRKRGIRSTGITLARQHSVEIGYLAIATVYSLTLPLKESITLIDAMVLVSIFILYTVRVAKAPAEEPHLVGPARYIGSFPTHRRRVTAISMAVGAAGIIILCAHPFAESLVHTGEALGISEFLLVQWLAPLASEAPELVIAFLFAWRLNTDAALGTLVSSKVNQWTLLVGTLPIVFAIASGSLHGLPIIGTQREELLLTAAQSFFAIAVLTSLSLSVKEAMMLFGLFWAQFVIGGIVPEHMHGIERIAVSLIYLTLGIAIFYRDRKKIRPLMRDAFRTPYGHLQKDRSQEGPSQ